MTQSRIALLLPLLAVACGGMGSSSSTPQAPLAQVGPNLAVPSGALVTLDGSGSSDPGGLALTYRWVQSSGAPVALSDPAASRPTFTAPVVPPGQPAATLGFSLTVSTARGASSPAEEMVTVNPAAGPTSQPPVASAGPDQVVASGAAVTLDGRGSSDPAGLPLSFQWVQVSGPPVALSSSTAASPGFAAPVVASGQPAEVLAFSLVVTSGGGTSAPSTVSVTVSPSPATAPPPPVVPPVANAGPDQIVPSGAVVVLDGSASADPAGAALSYQWTQASGPVASLSSTTAAQPTFVAPNVPSGQPPVALTFSLTVTSASGTSAPSQVTVTTSPLPPPNPAPVANAGPDQAVTSGAAVSLDGSASHDPDGQAISYAWTQTSGPAVSLSSATAVRPTLTAPPVASGAAPVTLVFSLVVADANASSTPASVTVTVDPIGTAFPPPPGTPAPAPFDPSPPPTGGSGSNRWEMGAAQGLYVVDPARGEPSVQGFVVVTFGSVSSGNFIPPAGTVVTLNGVPLLRDPNLNGAYWRVDPAGPQPVVGSGGRIVLVATATVSGKLEQRTLVFPCPGDVSVSSAPAIGGQLVPAAPPAAPLHVSTTADLTLNVGVPEMASIFPQATLYGYDPASRALVPSGAPQNIPPGPVDLNVPVLATTAGAYLMDLRWPGQWVIDGQSGGFCGLVKRWTYTR